VTFAHEAEVIPAASSPRESNVFVIPAAFSPRESGEGIQRLLYERHWVPAFAGTTINLPNVYRMYCRPPHHP